VSNHVRGDASVRERRSVSGSDGRNMFVENISDAVAGQRLAAVIDEDVLLVPTGIHVAQTVQGIGGLVPNRQHSLLAAFAAQPDLARWGQLQISPSRADGLADPSPRCCKGIVEACSRANRSRCADQGWR
jgi:hypothetical protein